MNADDYDILRAFTLAGGSMSYGAVGVTRGDRVRVWRLRQVGALEMNPTTFYLTLTGTGRLLLAAYDAPDLD